MDTICIAYVPVLHEGYRKFFKRHEDARTFYILGEEIIKEFTHLSKEIRQLDPALVGKAIESWGIFTDIEILDLKAIKKLQKDKISLVMPDEDIMKELSEKYFADKKVTFDNIFLRWDKHKSMEEKSVQADQKISAKKFDQDIIKKLKVEAEKSSDWWRRIGAGIIKNGEVVLVTHNKHVPSEHTPYVNGDPRNNLHKGVGIEYSSVIHAEAGLIAEAAKKGIALEGAHMYVTTFPCPPCAKQVAYSGIKKLYYSGGYSILNQEEILKSQGVEIIFVEM